MKKRTLFLVFFVFALLLCAFFVVQRKNSDSGYDDVELKVLNDLIRDLESSDVDTDTDSDADGISDYFENMFETDPAQSDTDGDGLPDSIELSSLLLSPLSKDTDEDGVEDGEEDTDSDGLTNLDEYNVGTDIINPDTDGDGLSDGDEITLYGTNPLLADTDSDGVDDAMEIAIGSNPSEESYSFNRTYGCQSFSNKIKAMVQLDGLNATQVNDFFITGITSGPLADSKIPGYIDTAFTFSEIGDFDFATVSMELEPSLFEDESFSPALYWYDRGNQLLIKVPEQRVSGNVVSCELSHFSDYILLNSTEQDEAWNIQIPFDDSDLILDTDNDGIYDYYEKALSNGTIRLGTGTKLMGIDYQNPDSDNDGLKDGQEIKIKRLGNRVYVYMMSNPTLEDTDGDGINDANDPNPSMRDVSAIVLYETLNSPGYTAKKDEKDNPQFDEFGEVIRDVSEDMCSNDQDESTLKNRKSDGYAESFLKDLISHGEKTSLDDMKRNMLKLFFVGMSNADEGVRNAGYEFIGRFWSGVGDKLPPDTDIEKNFAEAIQALEKAMQNESSWAKMQDAVKQFVINRLSNNAGNLLDLQYIARNRTISSTATAAYDTGMPSVSFDDKTGGLGILVHGFQGYKATIHDYKLEHNSFSGKIHFQFYDHFGLDLNDVRSYSTGLKSTIGKNFQDWYCLQHLKRFEGKYKPFISYFDFEDIEFSGIVKAEPEDVELSITGNVIDQHDGSPIQSATVKLFKKSDDTELVSSKTNSNGTFRINGISVEYNGGRVSDDFWNAYYLTIQKTGYENDHRINSNLSLVDSSDMSHNVYNLGDIELMAVNMRDVDIESVPEFEALNNLLLYIGGSFYSNEYHCDANAFYSNEDANILDSLLTGGFFPYYAVGANAIMTKWYATETNDDVPTPDAPWPWNLVYDAEQMDWILKSVFNVSDKIIRDIRYACQTDPENHWYYYQNGYYYIRDMEVTLLYDIPMIVSAKYDGFFYYIVYDALFEADYEFEGRRYAVVALKNRDGQDYWSVYHWCPSVPDEYDWGDPSSTAYRKWADESFWNGYYQQTIDILQMAYDSTGDAFSLNRKNGLEAFLQEYTEDIYHSGTIQVWDGTVYLDYFYVGSPKPFENIMGFSGFYVEAPTHVSFRSHDYYALLSDGRITYIGGSYGRYTPQVDFTFDEAPSGEYVVDIDGDGVTELICNCMGGGDGWLTTKVFRIRDGTIECGTLDYDLFLADVPTADWHRRIMDHYNPKTKTFGVSYTTTPENGEVSEKKQYSTPDVYSFEKLT